LKEDFFFFSSPSKRGRLFLLFLPLLWRGRIKEGEEKIKKEKREKNFFPSFFFKKIYKLAKFSPFRFIFYCAYFVV